MTIDVTAYEERVARFRWQVPEDFDFVRDVIDAWAEDRGRLAAVWPESSGGEGRATFWDLRDRSHRLAAVLKDRGVAAGDPVAVVLPEGIDWAVAILAVLRAGAVACPIDSESSAIEIGHLLDRVGAVAVIDQGGATVVSGREGTERVARADPGPSAAFPALTFPAGSAAVTFSRAWLFIQRHVAEFWLDLRRTDLVWAILSPQDALAVAAGLFAPWSVGAPVLFADGRPTPSLLARYPVSVLCAPGGFIEEIVASEPFPSSTLRHCTVRGAVPARTAEAWRRSAGLPLYVGWGRPECPLLAAHLRGVPVRPGSIGRPFPGHDLRVVDAEGAECDADAVGELVLRGGPPTLGRSSGSTLTGTLSTGVRARRDRQGDLWLADDDPSVHFGG